MWHKALEQQQFLPHFYTISLLQPHCLTSGLQYSNSTSLKLKLDKLQSIRTNHGDWKALKQIYLL